MDDDDFDPDSHTPEEIAAHEAEQRQRDEIYHLECELDDELAALKQLEHDDPVGVVWFGHDDAWIDARK
jgi:hypothetical protein